MVTIFDADFDDPDLIELIRLHLAGMHANSPPGSVYAMDTSGLRSADVRLFVARVGDDLAGMCALKELGRDHGEIKSMRTHPHHLRKGVGQALLDHVVGEARARGYRRLSLETGSGPGFEDATRLYIRNGFTPGGPFGAYAQSSFNRFFHRDL